MNEVVHFEIPVDDIGRAGKFYKTVFGWQLTPMKEMEYTMVQTTELDENRMPKKPGAINGGIVKRRRNYRNPIVVIAVPDIKEALALVKKNGGKVVGKKMEVPKMGWSAYFKDPEGNVIGLWQNLM